MIFGEGPIIKNIAGDINKLFLQGSRANQPIINVEGDAAADQGTVQLMADRDPVIRDISTGLGYETPPGREVTVSGTGALQLVNSLGRPLKSWSVELAPFQEGSGDPSPQNVRPIHGTDKINIVTSGANLFDKTAITPNTWITVNSTTTSYAAGYSVSDYIPVVKGASYWMMPKGSSRCAYYDKNKNGIAYFGSDGSNAAYFVPLYDGYIRITFSAQTNLDTYMFAVLPLGSDYVPYSAPSTTVITLPQTVYNATIGESWVESRTAKIVLDGTQAGISVNWRPSQTSVGILYPQSLTNNLIPLTDNTPIILLSDALPKVRYGDAFAMIVDEGVTVVTNSTIWGLCIRLPDSTLTTVALVNQYLAAHPITVVYELNTPIDFAISTPVIPTIEGDGSAWVTAEDGTVTNFSATYLQGE